MPLKALTSALCAALVLLSPGLEPYAAAGSAFEGEASGEAAGRAVPAVTPQVPSLSQVPLEKSPSVPVVPEAGLEAQLPAAAASAAAQAAPASVSATASAAPAPTEAKDAPTAVPGAAPVVVPGGRARFRAALALLRGAAGWKRALAPDSGGITAKPSEKASGSSLFPASPRKLSSASQVAENVRWIRGFLKTTVAAGVDVKRPLLVASALSLLTAALAFVPPVLWGQLLGHIKDVVAQHPASVSAALRLPIVASYLKVGGLLSLVYAVSAGLDYVYARLMYTIGNRMMQGVSDLFVRHVLALRMDWHDKRVVGDVVSTMMDAVYNVQSTATNTIVDTLKFGTIAVLSAAGLFYIDWRMSLGVVALLVLALSVPIAMLGKKTQAAYKLFFSQKKPKYASYVTELMVNILGVKAAGKEDEAMARVRDLSRGTYIDGGEAIARVAAPMRAMTGGISNVARVLITLTAVGFLLFGGMSLQAATAYFLIAGSLREAAERLSTVLVNLRNMRGSADKYDRIGAQPEEAVKPEGVKLPRSEHGREIVFEGAEFRYNKASANVLDKISLSIKPGQLIGFVGPSGSGKTTSVLALLGLYKLNGGKIRVDGVDVNDLALLPYRQDVGTALQDSIPFAASIADNIRWLRPGVSEQSVWDAARQVGLHREIERFGYNRALEPGPDASPEERRLLSRVLAALPAGADPNKSVLENLGGGVGVSFEQARQAAEKLGIADDVARLGYAMKVGERGVNLSGGQKQRLMLARLFVDPQNPWGIMILDEPTSALDGVSQGLVQEAMERFRGRSTTIVIAHRLSTIQKADQIVVFNNQGEIVQTGTHDQLMKDPDGAYAKLWTAQRLQAEAESARK